MQFDASRLRERGYLQSLAEGRRALDLWPGIIEARAAFLATVEEMTEAQAHWQPTGRPEADPWTATQVLQHVTGWTENIVDVGEAIAAGQPFHKNPSGFLDADPAESLASVRDRLVRASSRLSTFMAGPLAEARLDTTIDHATFGPMDMRGWLLRCRFHDGEHTNQVRQILETPGFPR